jgi:AAA domain
MTHPLFRQEIFVETAFEKRFQAMLRLAWHKRSWHVIVADPGAGKTMGIRDMIKTAGSKAVLAVTAPKNDDEELALGNQFFSALGLPLRGHWSNGKPKLMGYLHQYGTECLIVDDAHDLSLQHLMFLKELTDHRKEAVISATTAIKCTFSGGVVPIDPKRFQESGVTLVECPACACTRTLEPHGGVLRFKSHNKRKTTTPNTERRWAAKGEMDWNVVGAE